MYENTNSSIDWKGLFLKVVIAFLIVLIAVTGYKTFKDNKNNDSTQTTKKVAESTASTTFSANMEKLKEAGKKYYNDNLDKLPTTDNVPTVVTLNELVKNGVITNLIDAEGKTCDGDSSYVTAIKKGDEYTIKANLTCGVSSSYVTTYLAENDTEIKKEETVKVETISNDTSSSDKKNTCKTTSCNTPSVNVTTKTEANQTVIINKDDNTSNDSNNSSSNTRKNTYTVTFDKGTGSCYYRTRYVTEGDAVAYPGECEKRNHEFIGWYLNGKKYNFNTAVTRDIELVAKYDEEYDSDNEDTFVTEVYTMGWDTKGTDEIKVSHTLRLPEDMIDDLEDEDDIEITEIRIKDVEFTKAINTTSAAKRFRNRHEETFFYDYDKYKWEATDYSADSLATIDEDEVKITVHDDDFVDIDDAEDDGFDVTWRAYDVKKQCKNPFTVNGVSNLCNYGIVYKVIWEYKYRY